MKLRFGFHWTRKISNSTFTASIASCPETSIEPQRHPDITDHILSALVLQVYLIPRTTKYLLIAER